jgi:hypothetical protein
METDQPTWRIVQKVAVRFRPKVHAPKNSDRVIRRAYDTFFLKLLSHDRGDFARFLVARANHK